MNKSDTDVTLELTSTKDEADYDWDRYAVTLDATSDEFVTKNLDWTEDFVQGGWGTSGENAYDANTGLRIKIKSESGESAMETNFTLRKLGWKGKCEGSISNNFYANNDRLLWGPDKDKYPGLQVQVPQVLACVDGNDCWTKTAGWWYETLDNYGATPSVKAKLWDDTENDFIYKEFDGSQPLVDYGYSQIPSDGLDLNITIPLLAI